MNYVFTVKYKSLNNITSRVDKIEAKDLIDAENKINEKYNSDGKKLIKLSNLKLVT